MIRNKKSQTTDILAHLKRHGTITQLEATKLYGAIRLSSIIFVLRKNDINISTKMVNVKNRYGTISQIAVYHLEENERKEEDIYV